MWWHKFAELADAVLAYRDLDVLETFLKGVAPGEHTGHFELLDATVELCMELVPGRALSFLKYFDRLSVTHMENRILDHMAQMDRPAFDAEIARLAKERNYPETRAQILEASIKIRPEDAQDLLLEFLQNLDLNALHRYNGPKVALAVAQASLLTGNFDQAFGLLNNFGSATTWCKVAKLIPEDHPSIATVSEKVLASCNPSDSRELLPLIKNHPELFESVSEAMIEKAGRDRSQLENLVHGFAEIGDFERSNAVRMKIPKANRKHSTRYLVCGLIREGEFTTAMSVADELDSDYFGTGGREYEVLSSLTKFTWKAPTRIAEAM